MTEAEVAELMAELEAAYPDATFGWRENPKASLAVWHRGLSDLPADAVRAAVTRWITTQPKLPHISDLRETIVSIVAPVPSEADVWAMRWGYWRGELETSRGPDRADHLFALRIFKSIGAVLDTARMSEDTLRDRVKWAYKDAKGVELTDRKADLSELPRGTGHREVGGAYAEVAPGVSIARESSGFKKIGAG